MALKIESIQKGYYKAKIGDVILDNRTTERKAKDDGINYCLANGLDNYTILFPDFVEVSLDGLEDEPPMEEEPIDEEPPIDPEPPIDEEPPPIDEELTFPNNAYFITPDVEGNFTKAMVDDAVALGEKYIVFDADSLNIYYEGSDGAYIRFDGLKGTVENPITLDFRKVSIDCFLDPNNNLLKHEAFIFIDCINVVIKFGDVEGDKFKRTFETDAEIAMENTMLVTSGCLLYTSPSPRD